MMNEMKLACGVYPLSEGAYTIGWDKLFKPFDIIKDSMTDRPASLLVEIQPFLLVTEKEVLLLDTGLGFYNAQNQLIIEEALLNIGVSTSSITKVLLSHLHKDHLGGACKKEENHSKNLKATFANAVYYVQQGEWDYAYNHSGSSYEIETLEALKQSGQLELLNGDGKINDEIAYEISGGHTPFHQIFKVEANGKKYFYGGDVVPQLSQLQRRFIAKYDADGRRSADLRQQYAQQGLEQDWTFLFFHDLKTPYCELKMQNNMITAK